MTQQISMTYVIQCGGESEQKVIADQVVVPTISRTMKQLLNSPLHYKLIVVVIAFAAK